MARKRIKVSDLAHEAGLDLDDALVSLWDAGIDEVDGPSDYVPSGLVAAAHRALGIDGGREQMKVDFWLHATGLSRDELAKRLAEVGIVLPPSSRRIPKNSLRRLRRMFRPNEIVQPETRPAPQPLPPFSWQPIGKTQPRRFLTADEVRAIHEMLEDDFRASADPISPPGVRDEGLLESALARVHTSFGDTLKYSTTELAAAALFHSLVHNHAFHNGNKRTALVSTAAFLDENGWS